MTNATKTIASGAVAYVGYKVANNSILWAAIAGIATYYILGSQSARSTIGSYSKKAYSYMNK